MSSYAWSFLSAARQREVTMKSAEGLEVVWWFRETNAAMM
jgi:hypothetical protein